LINLNNAKSNYSQCKNNSNVKQTYGNYTPKKKNSILYFNSKFKLNLENFFILLFTIFSILVPIGIQAQLESNYAFAEINSQSINDEHEFAHEGKHLSHSSTSETKSKLNVKNPFDSGADYNKKAKPNILIPDMVGTDLLGTQPSSTNSHQISTHPSKEFHPNSVDNSISSTDRSDIVVKDKPTTTKLSSIHLRIGTPNNNINKNSNDVNSIVPDVNTGSEISQSELGSQPKYKSNSDYANTNSKNGQGTNESDGKPASGPSSTDAQIASAYSNINSNKNEKANETGIASEHQSNTTQSYSTKSSESQSNLIPRYKSYRDFINLNNSILNGDQKGIETDYKPVTGLNVTHSQFVCTSNNNSNMNTSTNNNNIIIISNGKGSNTELSSTVSGCSLVTVKSSK